MDLDDVTIGGNIHVITTGSTNRWYLTSRPAGDTATVTILGDIIMEAGQFSSNGTGNGCHIFIYHFGNITVTGGNFAVSRGSQGSGSGSTRWYFYGDSFSLSDATTQNSNALNAWFIFAGQIPQTLSLSNVAYGGDGLGGFPVVVASGATIDIDGDGIAGTGKFELEAGATLATSHVDGVNGAVATIGTVTLDEGASYVFNGSSAQVTGLLMPITVENITIANAAGVTLSDTTTVNGTLTLAKGVFDNTNPVVLGPSGAVTYVGGTLLIPLDGAFRSAADGNWSAAATWEVWNGSAWVAAASVPDGSESITIQSADSVNVDAAVSITGLLQVQGIIAGDANLTIAAGGTYQHDQDAGTIPSAMWAEGSTFLLTGTTSTAPNNRNQSFYNVILNTPNMASNRDLGWNGITIGGNIRVIATGTGSNRWQMTSPSAGDTVTIDIMGDVIVEGGQFSSNGSGSLFNINIHHYGNVNVTGGNFSISRGSQSSGVGFTRWYLHGESFSMSNATTQNSNPLNAWFVFAGEGTQTLALGDGNTLTALPIVVSGGAMLDVGTSQLAGTGRFELEANATLVLAHEGGVDSVYVGTGSFAASQDASFTFNGSSAQVTGTAMPDTVKNLTINNSSGVTLSQETHITGVLALQGGVFDNTIPFTLGLSAIISYDGGSLKIPTAIEETGGDIPTSFDVSQNYPNPFNPTTRIAFAIPSEADVKLEVFDILGRLVTTLVNERVQAGSYTVQFDAAGLSSGTYIYRLATPGKAISKMMVLLK